MTQRTAHMDLVWEKEDTGDYYAAALPDIPGYPNPKGGPYHAVVSEDTVTTSGGWLLYIALRPGVDLYEQDFGIQPTETAEEMMQAVDNLSVEDIVDALEANGKEPWGNDDTVAARHASKRTAALDLDWVNPSEDVYQADLPAIPGYTEPDGNDSFVTVTYDNDGGVEAVATIFPTQGGVVNLDCWNILEFIPQDETLEDVMQAFDDLDVYDFSYALEDMGIEPMVDENDEYVVASRHATQRAAHMDLNWQRQLTGAYMAELPAIPGYPTGGAFPAFSHTVMVLRPDYHEDIWAFQIGLVLLSDTSSEVTLTNEDFGILDGDSADEMMDAVENLNPQDIASVLEDFGFAPEEE